MKLRLNKYKECFSSKSFLISFFTALFLLIGSLIINYLAGTYAQESVSNPVTDIVLSNVPVFDLDLVFIYGTYIFWIFFISLCIIYPQKIPFTLKSVALFTIIRACFISMTHLGQFPTHIILDPASFINYFTFGGDLFFSGHTGIPFLMALIYWENRKLRIIFIVLSIMFAVTVLLTHLHYTIDVFSAFFITYTIYHISIKVFKKDRELFYRS